MKVIDMHLDSQENESYSYASGQSHGMQPSALYSRLVRILFDSDIMENRNQSCNVNSVVMFGRPMRVCGLS